MTGSHYPRHRDEAVEASPVFPDRERDTLAYWESDGTFQASIDARDAGEAGANEYVFYDGPPFANGLPHYGHLLTGYVKDIVARYQTQRGKRVERRFGWDTHGLPAELEAERILGITDKSEIEGGVGIAKFNETCRSSVLTYTKEWQDYVTRQARWVDFDNDYKTMDLPYMESVIWAFKTLYDKGLAYEGYRVLPYCWNDQTPLSNHELRMDDDVYQDRSDQTVSVAVRMESGDMAVIWTTTPWTLPSNLAIAVGPDIDYVRVEVGADGAEWLQGETLIFAKDLVEAYAKELGEQRRIVGECKGSELLGQRYYPMFTYFADRDASEAPGPNAWTIIPGDFVTTEDGTGLVHIAPAFGEDDMAICLEAGIEAVVPVDDAGCFTREVSDYAGTQVFDANKQVIRDMRNWAGPFERVDEARRCKLVRTESYTHSYPHCWRCRKPLIYKAVSSWFVKVTAFRDRMVELNQQIEWVPSYIKDGIFGKWLEGARDWSISRNRYWGSPIPVWKSDNPEYPRIDVYGSIAELERDFGVEVTDLHRPAIDDLVRPNPDDPTGRSMMRRIPDVLDCWFDSGSMPYAQVHYPFENTEWFENHYPGDFIVEYIGQTRGWFYTLHVLATALFDRPAFTSCISHGIVLGDDGRKMSKSLRNYPDVSGVFDTYGSDAMRWFLMSSPIVRGGNLIVTEKGIRDTVRHVILPLWNVYYFFTLYANACNGGEGYQAKLLDVDDREALAGLDVMDRYLLARTKGLIDGVAEALDAMDIPGACALVSDHIDLLTNWYVRTTRDRFWNEDARAYDTLYTALEAFLRAIAPLLPLLSEEMWRGLTGERSVHLSDYPVWSDAVADADLVAAMDEARAVVSSTHSLRKAHSLRVRQPLRTLTVVTEHPQALAPFGDLIAGEVNVKNVALDEVTTSGFQLRRDLKLNPKAFAPAVRKATSQLFKAQKAGEWEETETGVRFPGVEVEGAPVELDGDAIELTTSVAAAEGQVASVLASGTFVVLDTTLDAELEAEGYARDLVRKIQDERKKAGLHVADRIALNLMVPGDVIAGVREHSDMIAHETLATSVNIEEGDESITVAKA
ncbi:isoleucine--tRNA ligase [Nanchangia anserum]|uniref:Isoleucine--tRNA ligase n=1 Tax=Nanchangia anserum TaxID=2692125 RepID=A0A8I0KTV7_9ACTO|nr:isoleucine--tRNA ligase [Nanchangia anserum]MBD3689018.1 isoleucine--tRNA ligase [Nanchangia anserum]